MNETPLPKPAEPVPYFLPDWEETEVSPSIPVLEERLQVDKATVETGRVRLSKRVHEELETVSVALVEETHDVQRIPVNRYVDSPPAIRYEGDAVIVPVLREVVVVEKRLLLVEEIVLTKRRIETQHEQQVSLRREEIVVERMPVSFPQPSDLP